MPLSDAQKNAIDEALEDVANGRVHSHQYVMEETKNVSSFIQQIIHGTNYLD